ncbi:hypothetical protein GV792_04715 [Nocardia cyriacigeorgica]|uniref:hypothetical protein n=1 Tax=Nocardia cyriacigeorgica TaxID=135487 RepID=UPI0013BBAEAB|nr:hypothetical protein [Nocardia cyriacigeorgica]NEW49345.1 hypothetical protein [Nocardia cyriacigeorgica]
MPWKPSAPGEVPTLGYQAIDWMVENLAAPAKGEYEPFTPYLEQEDFILRWYEIDPTTGRFLRHRGLLGRPRGWGKSPLLAALAAFEALGDCLPDGWDADGQPVGRPWSTIRTPLVHIAAVSEEQTRNTWQPLLEMLREGPVLDNYPGVDPLETKVFLPRGAIEQITSSARTTKGAPIVFATLDQTEEWVPSNGGPKLAQAIRTNAAKNGGRTLESPNAYIPGEQSVAESSAAYAASIREGRARTKGLLWDHREAPPETDMSDRDSLIAGFRVAYGDSSGHPGGCVIHDPPCPPGHVDLDALVEQVYDPASDVQQLRSDLLNQITHASDSWVSAPVWEARKNLKSPIQPGDVVTLGFDGSMGRTKGKADATALIGCRLRDGHLFEVMVREAGQGEQNWVPNPMDFDAAVHQAFALYKVVGFYADPTGWQEWTTRWAARYRRRLKVKGTGTNPVHAWPRGKDARIEHYVEQLRQAIATGEMSHDGSGALTRHVLNARRRPTNTGYLLYKKYPDSPDKIDSAYAATLAWKARSDAVAAGLDRVSKPKRRGVVA